MNNSARAAGIQALNEKRSADALSLFRQALQDDPSDPALYAYLGIAYGQAGRFAEAAHALRRAVTLSPRSAPMRFNLAQALERLGRPEEAIGEYQAAVALDPTHERAAAAVRRLEVAAAPR
ncbi:MAG TPA: tetratricopeptide repeat protein, partial [Armatimonadota bacterium]|nr:tetratricopeptide repeat protein [Armatimonadota bacterium]